MDDPTDVSSQNGSGRHTLDEGFSTRNRKVEGSNPSSGSKTAGQRASLALPTARRHQAVIPWVGSSRRRRARPASLHRGAARLPTGLSWGQSPVGCTGKLHRGSATRRCRWRHTEAAFDAGWG